ncbi:MAG: hypothetical protein ACFCU8_01800 [Thermosynechococcaceae cyanobacterium]
MALKNEQAVNLRRLATLADVENSIPAALSNASFFFADIEHNQVSPEGVAILRYLAAQGEEGCNLAGEIENTSKDSLSDLEQRELIERVEGCDRFQVELIRCWFARCS